MTETSATNWLLWQLADSAFPTGGFAHSGGLEAARQYGEVRSRDDLVAFIETALFQSARGSLPFVRAAVQASHDFGEVDRFCDAFFSNHVSNRASRFQGQALLASTDRAFEDSALARLRRRISEESLPGHLAPIFGGVCGALQIDTSLALHLFLFIQLRGWISSAVRLNIVGPLEGQRIQRAFVGIAEAALAVGTTIELDAVAQEAPLLDLFQGGQDRLYSRLFQS